MGRHHIGKLLVLKSCKKRRLRADVAVHRCAARLPDWAATADDQRAYCDDDEAKETIGTLFAGRFLGPCPLKASIMMLGPFAVRTPAIGDLVQLETAGMQCEAGAL